MIVPPLMLAPLGGERGEYRMRRGREGEDTEE